MGSWQPSFPGRHRNSLLIAAASAGDGEGGPGPIRIQRGELTSAIAALCLLALMFLAKWYGVAGVPDPSAARPAISTAVNAWSGLSGVRWVMLAAILAALGSIILHVTQRAHGTQTDTSRVVLGLGLLTSGLLVYRVLIQLPPNGQVIDQKLGAVLGLLSALAITVGGFESRAQARGPAGPRTERAGRRAEVAGGRWPR